MTNARRRQDRWIGIAKLGLAFIPLTVVILVDGNVLSRTWGVLLVLGSVFPLLAVEVWHR